MAVAIGFWSLGEAMRYLEERPGPVEVVVARAVRLNQAGALLKVLEEKAAKGDWIVMEMERIRALARVDHLLSVAIDGLLPCLANRPYSQAQLNVLRDWSRELENTAAIVDRRCGSKMKRLSIKVRKFVVRSRRAAANHQDADVLLRKNGDIASLAKAQRASVVLLRELRTGGSAPAPQQAG